MAQLRKEHNSSSNELCSFCRPRLYDLSKLGWRANPDPVASNILLEPEWHLDVSGKPRLKSHTATDAFAENGHLPPGYDGLRGLEADGEESCIRVEYYREDILPECPVISTSATQGCRFCAVLISLIREDLTDFAYSQGLRPLFSAIEFHFVLTNPNILSPCDRAQFLFESLVVRKAQPANIRDHFFLLIAAPKDSTTSRILNIARRPNNANVADKDNITLIQSWLVACDGSKQHETCRSSDPPTLPSRVIDVSGVQTTGLVKLFVSNAFKAEYIALSYCWPRQDVAGSDTLVTKSDNISLMLSSITVSQLSGPQQTCLMLADKLGIQYVWIDGLCIIQDSDDDWRLESSKMGEIYKNAMLTIVPSANLSKPAERKIDSWYSIPWFFASEESLQGTYLLSVADGEALEMWCGGRYGAEKPPVTWPGVDNYIWKSRGWTFQEELLSTRKLYLGDTRMQFVCAQSRGMEDTLWLRKTKPLEPFRGRMTSFLVGPDGQTFTELHQLYDHWYQKLELYSDRLLTYPSDTLVAVGGLAERLSDAIRSLCPGTNNHIYIGGVWESDLARGLLWASEDILVPGINYLPCRKLLPADFEGASWLWSSHQLPSTRTQSHVKDKYFRYYFFLEGQREKACNLNFESQCRIMSYVLDPPSSPMFTPNRVLGEIEITGRMFELECIWEFRVSPFEGMQPLALPAPLEDVQGFDDPSIDTEGSGGISVRFERPGGGRNNWRFDCHWTQKIHDTVSCGEFRCFALLMAYGVLRNPFVRWRKRDKLGIMHSTVGLLLVPNDPTEHNPKTFRWFGTFIMPGAAVTTNQDGSMVDEEVNVLRADPVFDSIEAQTVIVY